MSASDLVTDQKTIVITSLVLMLPLLVMFSGLLYEIYKKRLRLYRLILLIVLLMLSSIFWCWEQILVYHRVKVDPNNTDPDTRYRVSEGILLILACVSFSMSHWIFSMKYWTCAKRLELLIQGKNPRKNDIFMMRLEILLCALNIIIPSMYGWTSSEIDNTATNTLTFYYIASFLNLLLTTASLFFLGGALLQIKILMKNREEFVINNRAMCLHVCTFSLYIITISTFFISDLVDPPPKDPEKHLLSEEMRISVIFLLQISLIILFYLLIKQATNQVNSERQEDGTSETTRTKSVSTYLYG